MKYLSWLSGPWLWAWWVGIVIGNILALMTFGTYLASGDLTVVLWGPFLYPFWIILVALIVTIPLGIVFTCAVVVWKSMVGAYHALPFTVRLEHTPTDWEKAWEDEEDRWDAGIRSGTAAKIIEQNERLSSR